MKAPLTDDYGLPGSEFERIRALVDKSESLCRRLSETFFILSLPSCILVSAVVGPSHGLLAAAVLYLASWITENSRALVKLTNRTDRDLIVGYLRFRNAAGRFVEWLLKTIPSRWTMLSRRDFELGVADLFESQGYQVDVTSSRSSARGAEDIDITAVKNGKVAILKCMLRRDPVGPEAMTALVMEMSTTKASEGILVSTSGFRSVVKRLVKRKPALRLVDAEELSLLQTELSWDAEFEDRPAKRTSRHPEGLIDRIVDFKEWVRALEDRGHASSMLAVMISYVVGGSIALIGLALLKMAAPVGILLSFAGAWVIFWLQGTGRVHAIG